MKFVGHGYLVEFDSYEVEGAKKYVYRFLVGDFDKKSGFLRQASFENCISDVPLIDKPTFMKVVDVECAVRNFYDKVAQRMVQKVSYSLVNKLGGDE